MRKFFNILKIILTVILFAYSLCFLLFIFVMPKERRFDFAGHMQGTYLSQSMFDVLTWQHPTYAKAYFEQSVALNKRGEYAKGFRLLDRAVELDPKMHLGYRGYMKLRFLRDYDAALADLDRLDSLTPNHTDAPWGEDIDFLRGEAWFGKENYRKSIQVFNRSLENQGEDWADIQTFVYLGMAEHKLGNYERAISEFQRALKYSASTPEAHLGLAQVYRETDNPSLAREHILEAEKSMAYKREDSYNEYLNEIYYSDIAAMKKELDLETASTTTADEHSRS